MSEQTIPMGGETPEVEIAKLADNALVNWEMVSAEILSAPSIPHELDIEHPDVKSYLIMLVNSVSSQVEVVIGKPLGKKTYRERFTTGPSHVVNLRNSPIRKVNKLTLIQADGTQMSHQLDSELIMDLNDKSDLNVGSLYLDTMYLPPSLKVGLGAYNTGYRRNMLITYEAGYVLPHQETEEETSDLPAAISGIVLDVVRREFEKRIDPQRSGDLIQLQEGNVSRMWGTSVMTDLALKGYFTKGEQEILKSFSSRRALYSV